MHLGHSKVAFTEGCPHVRGGLNEGFHYCTGVQYRYGKETTNTVFTRLEARASIY